MFKSKKNEDFFVEATVPGRALLMLLLLLLLLLLGTFSRFAAYTCSLLLFLVSSSLELNSFRWCRQVSVVVVLCLCDCSKPPATAAAAAAGQQLPLSCQPAAAQQQQQQQQQRLSWNISRSF